MRSLLILLSSFAISKTYASCDCQQVNSWNDLQQIINEANTIESISPPIVSLCPFTVGVNQNSGTIMDIQRSMQIKCHKTNPTDRCWIRVEKKTCPFGQDCGRKMVYIRSNDVTIDGLKVTHANDNIFLVEKGYSNIKLMDLEVFHTDIPGNTRGFPQAVITVKPTASIQIINSSFAWNRAAIVENKGGDVLMYDNGIQGNNVLTPNVEAIISNKKASSKLVLTQNQFLNNRASLGPVIASISNSYVFDGGQNCATNNIKDGYPYGCNGSYSFDAWTCTPFVVSEFCGNNRSIITEENSNETGLNAENNTETVFTIVNSTDTE